jgi:hypothetical protein
MIVFSAQCDRFQKKIFMFHLIMSDGAFVLAQPFSAGRHMYMIGRKGKDICVSKKIIFSAWCNTAAPVYRKYGDILLRDFNSACLWLWEFFIMTMLAFGDLLSLVHYSSCGAVFGRKISLISFLVGDIHAAPVFFVTRMCFGVEPPILFLRLGT